MVSKKSLIALALVGAIGIGGGIGVGTYAYFKSTAESSNNTITTGTVIIGKDATSTHWTASDIYPGKPDIKGLKYEITSSGSLPVNLDYTVIGTKTPRMDIKDEQINYNMLSFDVTVKHGATLLGTVNNVNISTIESNIDNLVKGVEIKNGEKVTVEVNNVNFSTEAQDDYQGAQFGMEIKATAHQTNATNNPNK